MVAACLGTAVVATRPILDPPPVVDDDLAGIDGPAHTRPLAMNRVPPASLAPFAGGASLIGAASWVCLFTAALAAEAPLEPGQTERLPPPAAVVAAAEPAPDARPNLAGLATATASTVQSGNTPDQALDGDGDTRWCASSGAAPQWWQADFAEPQRLVGIELDWEFADRGYRFRVETTADGATWEPAVDAAQGMKSPCAAAIAPRAGTAVRAVRVHFLGSDTGWGSLREVRLLAPEGTAVPSPRAASAARRQDSLAREIKPPEEFTASVFATPAQANYPVFVAATYDGTVFVSSDGNGSLGRDPHRGRIVRLRDTDGDGAADDVRNFVADVDSPRGLVWVDDRLIVLHPPHVSSFRDLDGDGHADERTLLVKGIAFDYSQRPADHTSNGLALGIDGWIYAAIGDFGFMDAAGVDGRRLQLRGGGLVRFRPDGTGLDLFARGTRNNLEAAVGPLLDMIARDNTNDGGGWDVRLHAFTGLEDHGYPRRYMHFTDEIVPPLADYGGGSGTGACWIDEPAIPSRFNDAAFTCDWGRNVVYRHAITPRGAACAAGQEEFLGLPRATDLDVDAAGHIYAASWRNGGFSWSGPDVGFVARLTPKAAEARPLPDVAALPPADLVGLLAGRSHRLRLEAQRALLSRGVDATSATALERLASDAGARPACRVAALFTLALGRVGDSLPALATLAADPAVSAWAVRALGDLAAAGLSVPRGPIDAALRATDPRTRKEAVVAAARIGDSAAIAALLPLSTDADPLVSHTAVEAVVRLARDRESDVLAACLRVLDDHATDPHRHRAVSRILGELHSEAVADAVTTRLAGCRAADRRADLVWAASRLWRRESAWKGDGWGTRPDTRGPYYAMETWPASERLLAAVQTAIDEATPDEFPALSRATGLHRLPAAAIVPRLLARSNSGPALVTFLDLAGDPPPAEALPAVSATAADGGTPSGMRLAAIRVLARHADAAVLPPLADAVLALAAAEPAAAEAAAARVILRDAAAALPAVAPLDSLATKDAAHAALVDELLLSVAASGSAKSGLRGEAAARLAAAWQSSAGRRAELVAASVASGSKALATSLVAAADQAEDAALAAAARAALGRLGIDADKVREVAADTGPAVGERPVDQVLALVDERRGDRTVGRELFVAKKCAACHATGVDSAGLGPSLANAAGIYNRKQLAESVLQPSRSIAQGFATTALVLDDGRQLVGFVTSEAADRIALRDAQGVEHVVDKKTVEERTKLPTSIMPEGLVGDLTIGQFASLIDFIESIGR